MPAGYSSRCKVCNSSHRTEIENWSKEGGLSSREISSKVLSLYDEKISHNSIATHLTEHYDVQAEARDQYYKSNENIKADAAKRLSDLEILDAIIQDNHIIRSGLTEQIKEQSNKMGVPMPAVTMLTGVSSEICRAIKTKQEILGEDGASKQADAIESLSEAELDARLDKLIQITKS